jgi:integrase
VETGVDLARQLERLTARTVDTRRMPGYYADGGGLYLQVSPGGSKSWIFRYTFAGRSREMGLGPAHTVSLAEARAAALEKRKIMVGGLDPIAARDDEKALQTLARSKSQTFDACATSFIRAHRPTWKSAKHAEQWSNTIATYASPIVGALPVQDIDTGHIVRVLEPIWTTKHETAGRLRGRIEKILDWAKVRGYRAGDNPARWRGHLEQTLPKISRRKRIEHHPAMPFDQVPAFLTALRQQPGNAARALEFLILTVARTSEVIGADPQELNLAEKVWTVPSERIKGHKEHRVPLSASAVAIIEALPASAFIFEGRKPDSPLSNMAMLALLDRMGHADLTVHGFRSSFRDWASERTNYPREVCEMALAHAIGDEVEAAYRRGDLFDKRRRMMNDWAKFCSTVGQEGKVLPLRRKPIRAA